MSTLVPVRKPLLLAGEVMATVGAVLRTKKTGAEVTDAPRLSVATATNALLPDGALNQPALNGATMASATLLVPAQKYTTNATGTSGSLAATARATLVGVKGKMVPASGWVMLTEGG